MMHLESDVTVDGDGQGPARVASLLAGEGEVADELLGRPEDRSESQETEYESRGRSPPSSPTRPVPGGLLARESWGDPDAAVNMWVAALRPPPGWDPCTVGSPPLKDEALGAALISSKKLELIRCAGELSCSKMFAEKLGGDDDQTLRAWQRLDTDREWVPDVKARVIRGLTKRAASPAQLCAATGVLDTMFAATDPCSRPRCFARELQRLGSGLALYHVW
jgi:hypothetical protein